MVDSTLNVTLNRVVQTAEPANPLRLQYKYLVDAGLEHTQFNDIKTLKALLTNVSLSGLNLDDKLYKAIDDLYVINEKACKGLLLGLSQKITYGEFVRTINDDPQPFCDFIEDFHVYQKSQYTSKTAGFFAFLYALAILVSVAIAISVLTAVPGPAAALAVAAIALGLVSFMTNLKFSYVDLKETLYKWRLTARSFWKSRPAKLFVIFSLASSVLMGLTIQGSFFKNMANFLQLFQGGGEATKEFIKMISDHLGPVMYTIMAIMIAVEAVMFIQAGIDCFRAGGPTGPLKLIVDKAKATLKNANGSGWNPLAVLLFAVLLTCNIAFIILLSKSAVGVFDDAKNIPDKLKLALQWTLGIMAGLGMISFYIRQSLGFAGDASKLMQGTRQGVTWKDVGNFCYKFAPAILIITAAISCYATGFGTIALAIVAVSALLHTVYKRLIEPRLDKQSESSDQSQLVETGRGANAVNNGVLLTAAMGLNVGGILAGTAAAFTSKAATYQGGLSKASTCDDTKIRTVQHHGFFSGSGGDNQACTAHNFGSVL